MSMIENVWRQRHKDGVLEDLLILALQESEEECEYWLRKGVVEIKEQIREGKNVVKN